MPPFPPRARALRTKAVAGQRLRSLAARVDLHVHPSAQVGDVILRTSGARCRLLIGPESRLEDGVILQLSQGASVEIGPRCHLRSGAVLNVSGRLQLLGDNQISFYSVVHCAESVLFEEMAGAAEGVTVVDSQHFHGDVGASDEHYYHNNRTSPVVIGRNTWLAARSVITSGVTLGSRVTVAGNSLVAPGTYADGATLVGVPARMAMRRPAADRSN